MTEALTDEQRKHWLETELLRNEIDALVDMLTECREFIDGYIDTVDGPDGQPRPNKAMSLANDLDHLLGEYT